jgi:hypothetical protein
MSDEFGTTGNPEGVAQMVAETEDADSLQLELARVKDENTKLLSNIGRQNQVHGERLQALQAEIQALREEKDRERAEAAERAYQAQLRSMSPSERAEAIAKNAEARVRQLETREQVAAARAAEAEFIAGVIEEARKLDLDHTQIDTSSQDKALLSFHALKEEKRDKELAELKKELAKRRDEDREEIAETIRNVSGQRMVATGSPMGKAANKVDPKAEELKRELLVAKRRGDKAAIMSVIMRASQAGISLR